MLKKILVVLALVVVGFVVVVLLQPAEFKVERSAVIDAPAPVVFEQLNDLHKWNDWSPWSKLDPNSKVTFDGPVAGVGAGFAWAGNNEVGEGHMTITESTPNELIRMKLEFVKPFEATSTTEFTLEPQGEGTKVTWSMSGRNNFMGKAVSLFMDCDKMVGDQFEQGFDNLKSVAKKSSQP